MSVSVSEHPNGGALLHGKRMLVTGASAGIGRAIALTAARQMAIGGASCMDGVALHV